jgi:CHAT domain-containing protein/Tfp pilus assembly protein PilF
MNKYELLNWPKRLNCLLIILVVCVSVTKTQTPTEKVLNTDERLADAKFDYQAAQTLYAQGTDNTKRAAFALFESTGEKFKALGIKGGEAGCFNAAGMIAIELGYKSAAIRNLKKAAELFKSLSELDWEAQTLASLGDVYASLGERQMAMEQYQKALSIYKNQGNILGDISISSRIALQYTNLGKYEEALNIYNITLDFSRKSGDKKSEYIALNSIGLVYLNQGKFETSLKYLNESLELRRKYGDRVSIATILMGIGSTQLKAGDKTRASESITQALAIWRFIDYKQGEATCLDYLMIISRDAGNPNLSVFYGKQAIKILQELRKQLKDLDKTTQNTYLRTIERTYRRLADILIKEKRISEAHQVLNSFRDQQFFDVAKETSDSTSQIIDLTLNEISSEKNFIDSLNKITEIGKQSEETAKQFINRIPRAERSPGLVLAAQKIYEPEFQVSLADFQRTQKQLETNLVNTNDSENNINEKIRDTREMRISLQNLNEQTKQKTVAVYTLVGEDNFRALIVSPDGIKAVSSPIKGTELNDNALKLWGLLQSDKYDTTVLSKQIYDVVFAPIEKELPRDTTTLMWSLDGNLRYLPMAALWDGKRFLAERYNHVNFTRADGERLTRNVNPNWTGTGFGTSNAQTVELLGDKIKFKALRGVTAELREIFKQTDSKTGILTGEVLRDAKFTKLSFLAAMKQKRPLVHIASHFSFRPGDEARSFLLLGDGTALTLNEMKAETDLFQGVDLLTLSACNTAAAQADANGREIDGFAELAQRLGAGAVMATLWSVSDASTPWLMRDFYATRQSKPDITKAEALRRAQISLLKGTAETKPLPSAEKGTASDKLQITIVPRGEKRDGGQVRDTTDTALYVSEKDAPLYDKHGKPPFAHPYYWSPFVLFGNWR